MNSSSVPQIHLFITLKEESLYQPCRTQDQMHLYLADLKKRYPYLDIEKDVRAIVGTNRCVKAKPMRGSVKYVLSATGCNCG